MWQVSFETPEYTANADAHRHAAPARGDPHPRHGEEDALLPGLDLRALRHGAGGAAARDHAVLSAQPYAAAKLYAYWIAVNYREAYGMHASNGILFNHESPLRGETFVTRKITRAAAAIKLGRQDKLYLGNLDAKRDWGHAREYVARHVADAAAGRARRLCARDRRDALRCASSSNGRSRSRHRTRLARRRRRRKGTVPPTGKAMVEVDPRYFRPTEVDLLIGDPAKAHQKLGWTHETPVRELAREMVRDDLKVMRRRDR